MVDNTNKPTFIPVPVTTGMCVEIELVSRSGETERLEFIIVPDEQADFKAGFLGEGTPLAKAILGQDVGGEFPYPVADMRSIKILSAVPSDRTQTEDVASRREAVIRDAVNKSEFTSAMIFSTTVDNKWGSYDSDGLDPDKWTS